MVYSLIRNIWISGDSHKVRKIKELCLQYKIKNYTINEDFTGSYSINVNGDVYLKKLDLIEIPVTFNIVTGNFNCSYNKLTSLQGAPRKVGGYFNCTGNLLTSLKGSPIEVHGRFFCNGNQLISLEGAPNEVNGFYCSYNQLTSLEGAPKKVRGNFCCDNNQLVTLHGSPDKVHNFQCNYNPTLISLNGISDIHGEISCYGSPIDEVVRLFRDSAKFLEVFETYNLFQVPGVIDSAVIEEIALHLGRKLPENWAYCRATLKSYQVV